MKFSKIPTPDIPVMVGKPVACPLNWEMWPHEYVTQYQNHVDEVEIINKKLATSVRAEMILLGFFALTLLLGGGTDTTFPILAVILFPFLVAAINNIIQKELKTDREKSLQWLKDHPSSVCVVDTVEPSDPKYRTAYVLGEQGKRDTSTMKEQRLLNLWAVAAQAEKENTVTVEK